MADTSVIKGDQVRLKISKQWMIVMAIEGETAVCEWQVDGTPHERRYPLSALVKAQPRNNDRHVVGVVGSRGSRRTTTYLDGIPRPWLGRQ